MIEDIIALPGHCMGCNSLSRRAVWQMKEGSDKKAALSRLKRCHSGLTGPNMSPPTAPVDIFRRTTDVTRPLVKQVAHTCIFARDLTAVEAFYRDVIGVAPKFDFKRGEDRIGF